MKLGGLQILFLGTFLAFAPVAHAQDVEHLSLPASGITDRPLPPARDGGIYLPHASGGGAMIAKGKTVKAGKVAKAKTTLKKGKVKGKAALTSVKGKGGAKDRALSQKNHKTKAAAQKTKVSNSLKPKKKIKTKR